MSTGVQLEFGPTPARRDPMPKLLKFLAILLASMLALGSPARAAVELAFYSYELDVDGADLRFPHAFVRLTGALDAGGPPMDHNFGFTARSISPAILLGSVKGELHRAPTRYLAKSDKQFAVRLTDAQYAAVRERLIAWEAEGLTYNLNRRNCVHFVREIARAAGLQVDGSNKLIKKPRSFLQDLARRNGGTRSAVVPTVAR